MHKLTPSQKIIAIEMIHNLKKIKECDDELIRTGYRFLVTGFDVDKEIKRLESLIEE